MGCIRSHLPNLHQTRHSVTIIIHPSHAWCPAKQILMISILSCREKKLDAKHMLIALSAYVGGKKTHVVGCQLFFIKAKIYRGEDELLF
jgi:hypothetical protein